VRCGRSTKPFILGTQVPVDKEMLARLQGQDDIDEEGALEAKLLSDVSSARREPLPDPPNVVLKRPVVPEMTIRGARGMQISVSEARSMGDGWNIASALTSSLIAGVLVGLALDKWVTTKWAPAGLIVGFVLGCISGFANLIKLTNRLAARDEAAKRAADSALDGTSSKQ
jgi:F0F1-type ATP synthase assembly protein I